MVHLFWNRFHFLLIFIDEMAFQGWSVKVPKTYNSLKSVEICITITHRICDILGVGFVFH